MSNDKTHKCSECGFKLTDHEVSDNQYLKLAPAEFVCYDCRTRVVDFINNDIEPEYMDDDHDMNVEW